MMDWESLDLVHDDFWRRTPREMVASLTAATMRLERQHNNNVWLAWNTAAMTRTQKKLPKFESMLVRRTTARRTQTWQDQMMVMDRWMMVQQRRAQQLAKAKAEDGR